MFSELSGDTAAEDALVETFQRTRGGTVDEVRQRIVAGSPEQMIEVLRAYGRAGVSTVIWANHMMRDSITAMRETSLIIYYYKSLI